MLTSGDSAARRAEQDARLDALHEKLAEQVAHLVTGADWARALQTASRFRAYSAANSLLIWIQHTDAYVQGLVPEPVPTLVAGVRGWNSVGRSVIRGQKGLMIRLPVLGRFAAASPDAQADSWRRLGHRERLRPGEVLKTRLVATKVGHVFDVSQTHGAPLATFPDPVLLEGEAPAGLWDGVTAQITRAGFAVGHVSSAREIHGANALTSYTTRTVSVRADMDPAAQARSLIHDPLTAPSSAGQAVSAVVC
jgi:hypothetical protein